MKTTNDLMNELKYNVSNERSLDEYLDRIEKYNGTSFPEYFSYLMEKYGKERSEVIKASLIERTFASHMISGDKTVTRNNLIALCLSVGCNTSEVEKCLALTGNAALYPKEVRDSILIYAINRGLTVQQANELLYSKGMDLIVK